MEPVEQLVRVRVPDRAVEVRVHGISGTPPQALLGAFPVRVAGDADAGFYRARDAGEVGGIAEAFSWGGLTSRSRVTALWLFLAPLALINVAGWMSPTHSLPDRSRPRAARATGPGVRAQAVREGAMRVVTVVATAMVAAIAVQAAASVMGFMAADAPLASGSAAAVILLAALVPAGLHLLAKVGAAPADDGNHDDPWGRVRALQSLALAHLGIALAVVAVVGWAVTLDGTRLTGVGETIAVAAVVMLAGAGLALGIAAVFGTRVAGRDRGHIAAAPAAAAGGASVMAAAVATVIRDSSGSAAGGLTLVHFVLAALAVATLAVAYGAERRMPVRDSAGYSVAFAALGFFMSFSAFGALSYGLLGLSSGRSLREFVEEPAPAAMFRLVDFAALVLTCGVLFISARFVGHVRPLAPAGELGVDAATRLREAVDRAPVEVRRAGLGMLAAAGVLVLGEVLRLVLPSQEWAQSVGRLVTEPRLVIGAVGWLFVAYLVMRVCSGRRAALIIAAASAAGVGLLLWLLRLGDFDALSWARIGRDAEGAPSGGSEGTDTDPSQTVLGDAAPAAWLADPWVLASGFTLIAVTVALFIPAIAVLWFVASASGTRESRRGVGVVWDLANFWPRLHHPWAPPPYSETAIPALEHRLTDLRFDHPSHRIILSCHSQGAMLGFPAMRRLLTDDPSGAESLRFLSYGTLLSAHYQRLFPHLFDDDRLGDLERASPGGWLHLFRETDPLGHPILVLGPSSRLTSHTPPRRVPTVLAHSNYGYSPEYQRALDDLAAGAEPRRA